VVTALLFNIGKFLIGLYLAHGAMASSYGAAGALIIVLLWIYYSAQIFLLGAEFTKVYASRRGTQPPSAPSSDAARNVAVTTAGAAPALGSPSPRPYETHG
jgi:membrane protein